MPSFVHRAAIETDVDIDIEVFCGRCGEGICNESTIRYSRHRKEPQLVAECRDCSKLITHLEAEVARLQNELTCATGTEEP